MNSLFVCSKLLKYKRNYRIYRELGADAWHEV